MNKKIIFAGLDNSGKTSIIYILNRRFSLLTSIRPTLGSNQVSKNILGTEIVQWDLGGQKKYRDKYFKEKYMIFSNVSIMFYVIDINDRIRYDESLQYLKDIIDLFVDLKEKPIIYILFHKYDPDLKKGHAFDKDIKELTNKIKVSEFRNEFDVFFSETSIHDEASILKSFSSGFIAVSEKIKMINSILREYAKSTFSSVVLLLDEISFIIGAHYTRKNLMGVCEVLAPRFSIVMERMREYSVSIENLMMQTSFYEDDTKKGSNGSNEDAKGNAGKKLTKAMVFMRELNLDENTNAYIVSLAKNERTMKLSLQFLPELSTKIKNILDSCQ